MIPPPPPTRKCRSSRVADADRRGTLIGVYLPLPKPTAAEHHPDPRLRARPFVDVLDVLLDSTTQGSTR